MQVLLTPCRLTGEILALRRARREGQALVLGAVSMFIIALALMMSLNLSQAIHEKIRLQNQADTLSYSMAVVEARTFNYLSVSNRAMAAAYVAMTTLHAYMAIASSAGPLMIAAAKAFGVIAIVIELPQCLATFPMPNLHCFHMYKAGRIAFKFLSEGNKLNAKARSLDSRFRRAIQAYDFMIDAIHATQLLMLGDLVNKLRGKGGLETLHDQNAPQSSAIPIGVAAMSVNELGCAIEGTEALPCFGGESRKPLPERQKIMASIANASRPKWPPNRSEVLSAFSMLNKNTSLNQLILLKLFVTIPFLSAGIAGPYKGTTRVADGSGHGDLVGGGRVTGKTIGADAGHAWVGFLWFGGDPSPGLWRAEDAYVVSGNPQKHTPGDAHGADHPFDGVSAKESCVVSGNCFINFRISADQEKDYGQPAVFSYVTQRLEHDEQGRTQPWQLNERGRTSFTHGNSGTGSLTLAAGKGAAMSKSLVYFHRLGDWALHPNMFLPYWRAKLHPFTKTEATLVAGAAGDSTAAEQALLGPVLQ